MELASPAFEAGGAIPERYTCAGAGVSPPLMWSAPPAGTRSLALIFGRRAATAADTLPETVLWVLYNLPHSVRELPEGHRPAGDETGAGAFLGTNDFGVRGYDGPCPAADRSSRYVFRLYALDTVLPDDAGATERGLMAAIAPHVLAVAELDGTYAYDSD